MNSWFKRCCAWLVVLSILSVSLIVYAEGADGVDGAEEYYLEDIEEELLSREGALTEGDHSVEAVERDEDLDTIEKSQDDCDYGSETVCTDECNSTEVSSGEVSYCKAAGSMNSASGTKREHIIQIAESQVGYREAAGNDNRFGSELGYNYQEWCAFFVQWCAIKAGVEDLWPTVREAHGSTTTIANWFNKRNLYHNKMTWNGEYLSWSYNGYVKAMPNDTYEPKPGDFVAIKNMDWGTDSNGRLKYPEPNHTALVIKVTSDEIVTVEGNIKDQVVKYHYYNSGDKKYWGKDNGQRLSGFGEVNYGDEIDESSTAPVAQRPTGLLDLVEAGEGTVRVRGWAFDFDDPSIQLEIRVYIGGDAGSGAECHSGIVANLESGDLYQNFGEDIGPNHRFDATIETDKRGNLPVYVYACDVGSSWIGDIQIGRTETVNIKARPSKVSLDTDAVEIKVGESVVITRSFTAGDGAKQINGRLGISGIVSQSYVKDSAETSDNYHYTIKETLTGLKAGTTTYSAETWDENGNVICSQTISVKVVEPVSSVKINKDYLSLCVEDIETLEATVYPNNAANRKIVWNSDNTKVAVIDVNGTVIAKSVGNAWITASVDGSRELGKCQVVVTEKPITVYFNANGGNISALSKIVKSGELYGTLPSPTRLGYEFAGWHTSNGTEIRDNTTVDIRSDHTLYAYWGSDKLATWTIYFDANGGTGTMQNESVLEGADYVLPENSFMAPKGKRFKEWFIENNTFAPGYKLKNLKGSMTVRAVWESIEEGIEGDTSVDITIPESDEAKQKDYGDVLLNDIPVSGIIPEGIWVAGIVDKEYDGSLKTQNFRVYNGTKLLNETVDYTVIYKNNLKAYIVNNANYPTSDDMKKAPQIIIRMKGNYSGTQTVYFTITPPDIGDEEAFNASDIFAQYNKRKQTPAVILTWNGKKLRQGTDFTVLEYEENKYVKTAFIGKPEGNEIQTLTLLGKGNFSGRRNISFTIFGTKTTENDGAVSQVLMNRVKTTVVPNQSYTGSAYTLSTLKDKKGNPLDFIVSYKNKTLVDGIDYSVELINSKYPGVASIRLQGMNSIQSEAGYSFVGEKVVSFKINGTSISKANVLGLNKSYPYTGAEVKPNVTLSLYGLTADDYMVEYKNNIKAGTATIVFTGKNGFTGTKNATFRISGYQISGSDIQVNGDRDISVQYMKGGVKPEVTVTYQGSTLIKGKDYTVSYANMGKVASKTDNKAPTITITGKGDFLGKRTVKYSITERDFRQGVTVLASDRIEGSRANQYSTTLRLIDSNGQVLQAGKDYVKTVRYFDIADSTNTPLDKTSWPHAGTIIRVEVLGMGNYGKETISATYRILPVNTDISKAAIKIAAQSYTGKAVEITHQEQFQIDKNGNYQVYIKTRTGIQYLTLGKDFEVVTGSYKNNVNKGTASVIFRGINDYGGFKTVTFSIGAFSITDFWKGIQKSIAQTDEPYYCEDIKLYWTKEVA